jgi:hypothetical protein
MGRHGPTVLSHPTDGVTDKYYKSWTARDQQAQKHQHMLSPPPLNATLSCHVLLWGSV